MLMLKVDLLGQYPALAAVEACKADKQLDNNLDFPINKIHIRECDLYDMEILGYTHS